MKNAQLLNYVKDIKKDIEVPINQSKIAQTWTKVKRGLRLGRILEPLQKCVELPSHLEGLRAIFTVSRSLRTLENRGGGSYDQRSPFTPSSTCPPQVGDNARRPFASRKGFTLAEVLITLGIIGIIAALSIPTLIQNNQKQSTAKKLQKFYSTIMQANNLSVMDNGPITSWFTSDITDGSSTGAQKFADTYLVPYLSVSKNCGLTAEAACDNNIRSLDPSFGTVISFDSTRSRFFLNDGTYIAIYPYNSSTMQMTLAVDLNGLSGPNVLGKDAFYFQYKSSSGKFIPEGISGDRTSLLSATWGPGWGCDKNGGRGTTCATVIMKDSWQIKDDYPW